MPQPKRTRRRVVVAPEEASPPLEGMDLGTLAGLLGFHVRMAQAVIYRDFAAAVAGLDLTQKQFAVLELLAANPGASQIDLGATLGTDRATMMALVDRLAARGWVERAVSANDRRRQELRLTQTGQAGLSEARQLVVAHEARLLADISPAERQLVIDVLGRLRQATATGPADSPA